MLCYAAIVMAWNPARTLRERFAVARETVVAMFPDRRRAGRSYRGFADALRLVSGWLIPHVQRQLRLAMTAPGIGTRTRTGQTIGGWSAFAVDGSRIDCPRTLANETDIGIAGKDGTHPQLWLTTIWHLGLGLPWTWRIGKARDSERTHLLHLLHLLPAAAMLVMDAGFTGFDLLKRIDDSGRFFLLRVGRHVTLLKALGYHRREGRHTVYLWRKDRRNEPPLTLRLIEIKRKGRVMYLLTNVRASTRLSKAAAMTLYQRRWGVEVFYRSLKQTLDRRKMLSHSPANTRTELHWSLVGLWLLGLLNVKMLIACGRHPRQASCAGALRVMREAVRQAYRPAQNILTLLGKLGEAVKDQAPRRSSKSSYQWPRKKREAPPGAPIIRLATDEEIQAAQALRSIKAM